MCAISSLSFDCPHPLVDGHLQLVPRSSHHQTLTRYHNGKAIGIRQIISRQQWISPYWSSRRYSLGLCPPNWHHLALSPPLLHSQPWLILKEEAHKLILPLSLEMAHILSCPCHWRWRTSYPALVSMILHLPL
ncbi:hypothetical protein AMTR_s00010p00190440 [Amborella trichopoda]|uniref:Uncharacterized protein n=1 Tax=Amborella trichopoda TaxID=13333 RepID=W1NEL2_AMBTC|nr:hypothetical protein AMTR_s00010p00190440 [Amborella trichopoda]